MRSITRLLAGPPGPVALTEERIRADGFGPSRRFEVLPAEMDGLICGAVVLFGLFDVAGQADAGQSTISSSRKTRAAAGRALVASAARLAVERECCRLDVNVLAWNAQGRRFYESLGFGALDDWVPYRLDQDGMERLVRQPA